MLRSKLHCQKKCSLKLFSCKIRGDPDREIAQGVQFKVVFAIYSPPMRSVAIPLVFTVGPNASFI